MTKDAGGAAFHGVSPQRAPRAQSERRRDPNDLTSRIIGGAIEVHRALGPGLLESAYQSCLEVELEDLGLEVERQRPLAVTYKGREIDCSYRLDLVIEQTVLVELKAVAKIDEVHVAQILTYLKLTGLHIGLLINFNVPLLRDGIRRIVLNLPEPK